MPDAPVLTAVNASQLNHPLCAHFHRPFKRQDAILPMQRLLQRNPGFVGCLSFTGLPGKDSVCAMSVAGSDENDIDGDYLTETGRLLLGFHGEDITRAVMRAWDICRLHLSLPELIGVNWVCAVNRTTCTFLPARRDGDIATLPGIRAALLPPLFSESTPRLTRWAGLGNTAAAVACSPAFGPHPSNHAAVSWSGEMPAHFATIMKTLYTNPEAA